MHVCGFQSIVPSGSFARVGVASAPSTTTTTRPFGAGTLHTTIKRIPTNGIPEIVQAGMPRTYDKKTRLIVSILFFSIHIFSFNRISDFHDCWNRLEPDLELSPPVLAGAVFCRSCSPGTSGRVRCEGRGSTEKL
ncbi:hypothetical protein M408DRAFT_160789 [Serendipita vermifera MAFF 305830]|uniref:Uncharacterized protein n=1 Tax=Serendipita vermifera MAFF 305830 TaxID=933852 RepID=A0A0C3ATJ8_SERVB|nr:hypothetical protein M408DRAFT_160789 [Serendipita vermifera MAFF 305830]